MYINGVNFPNEVVDAIKSGKLVVFAGAGVSMGEPTNLPSFNSLADKLADGTAYVREKNDLCEVFLGTLKVHDIPVNEDAAKILSEECLLHNLEHEAIVNLFINPTQIRIVTTNYDQMFEQYIDERKLDVRVYDAPALPLGSDFSGIIHIHGNVNCPQYMIVTDEDFGKAYLTDGYASRFLVQLLSSYTVLFIGYSYNDTIVRYLTRAMPRNKGQRYVMDDKDDTKWSDLGITPIKFPKEKYDVLIASLQKLGERTKRGLLEWKECLQDIADMPPKDRSFESEIAYCLVDEERTQVLASVIQGKEWLEYLDERKIFNPLFSEIAENNKINNTWSDWICNRIIGKEDEAFMWLLCKHHNVISRYLLDKILWRLWRDEVNAETLAYYSILFFDKIVDHFHIFQMIEKCRECNLLSLSLKYYKKYWDYDFILDSRYSTLKYLDYKHVFKGEPYSTQDSWKKCQDYFLEQNNAKGLLVFFRTTLERLHVDYSEVDLASESSMPFSMRFVDVEGKRENHLGMLDIAVAQMRMLASQIAIDNPEFIKAYLTEALNTKAPFFRVVSLKLLRECQIFRPDEKYELVCKRLGDEVGRKQMLFLISELYGDLSRKNKDALIEYISNLGQDKYGSEYEKYEWCALILEKNKRDKRISEIEKDILERNPNYSLKDSPTLREYEIESISISPESPWSLDELKESALDELIDKVTTFKEDFFGGPTKWGVLNVFSKTIAEKQEWALTIPDSLLIKGVKDNDIWRAYFEGIVSDKYQLTTSIELLKKLNGIDDLNQFSEYKANLLWKIVCRDDSGATVLENEECLFEQVKLIWKNRNDEKVSGFRIIDYSLNSTVGLILMAIIRLISYDKTLAIKGQYISFFEEAMDIVTWERPIVISILAGHFNFFYYRNRTWTNNRFEKMLRGRDQEDYVAAWEGIVYFSKSLNKDVADDMAKIYLEAITHIDWLEGEARNGLIEMFLVLLIYVVPNPILKYIPAFYKNGAIEDRTRFAEDIERRLMNMEDESQKAWWEAWLKRFLTNLNSNRPIKIDMKERAKIIDWLPEMKSIYGEAVDIICVSKIPSNIDIQFLYQLDYKECAKRDTHATAKLLIALLNAGNFYRGDSIIEKIINCLSDLDDNEKHGLKEALLKQGIAETIS